MECFLEIENIIWLDVFTEKLWRRHRVSTEEVEEALHSSTRIRFIEKGDVKGEDVYAALGRTRAGRYLITFFIRKADNSALVISARDMSKTERKYYGKI